MHSVRFPFPSVTRQCAWSSHAWLHQTPWHPNPSHLGNLWPWHTLLIWNPSWGPNEEEAAVSPHLPFPSGLGLFSGDPPQGPSSQIVSNSAVSSLRLTAACLTFVTLVRIVLSHFLCIIPGFLHALLREEGHRSGCTESFMPLYDLVALDPGWTLESPGGFL